MNFEIRTGANLKCTDAEEDPGDLVSQMLIEIIAAGLALAIIIFLVIFFKITYISKGARLTAALGACSLLAFPVLLYYAIDFTRVSVSAAGTVTELIKHSTRSEGRLRTTYFPRVTFTGVDGRSHSFVSNVGSTLPEYEVDEPVQVLYNPESPNMAVIHSPLGMISVWLYPFTMILIAAILISSSGVLKPFLPRLIGLASPDFKKIMETLRMLQERGVRVKYDDLNHSQFCELILKGKKITDEDLELLQYVRHLNVLDLSRTLVTDAGLKHLAPLKHLTTLMLNKTNITGEGLIHLAQLPVLKRLELSKTPLTNSGIERLAGCPVQYLELNRTSLDENVLPAFDNLPQLRFVSLDHTSIGESLYDALISRLAART